jgi:hypothetical protein
LPGELRSASLAIAVALIVGVGACAQSRGTAPSLPPLPMPTPGTPPTPVVNPIDAVIERLGPRVRPRWEALFRAARLSYPPAELALLAFKRERRLEVWARDGGAWARIDAIAILAASGGAGPKLRQGDLQVPEGLYRLIAFNPNSRFHLSMMLDYPNTDDLAFAAADGRFDLGGDIFIHGDTRSIGCLAIGDRPIEDLFVLVADLGIDHVQVVIAPHDPRGGIRLAPIPGLPFTADLYARIEAALVPFGAPAGFQ